MDLEKVEKLIGLMKQYELGELRVTDKDWEFSARRGDRPQAQQPFMIQSSMPQAAASSATSPAVAEPAIPMATNLKEITAPIVGTFYRQPAPDQPVFKEVGDHVNPDDVVCIVEAMKVMNEIKAGISGKIKKILLENASPVEYGQVLFLVEAG
jgi:acetyl-CoA carboxylase biotin carboxyl carrier protein